MRDVKAVNEWFDNTLRSRLNRQEEGAIIIIMQRLHADDLVAHVQKTEQLDGAIFPAIAEKTATLQDSESRTRPIGFVERKGTFSNRPVLPDMFCRISAKAMTEYNFAAQYQQNPQPPVGNIVKREWLKFYTPEGTT